VEIGELKVALLKLLREDVEFRYAVADLIGLEEILRRLDKQEELARLREDVNKWLERLLEENNKI
jgi:hypothetical protein